MAFSLEANGGTEDLMDPSMLDVTFESKFFDNELGW
jgi:hypothetical protein